MKPDEYEAMRDLTRTETKVYLHLRHHMDYATGVVGAVRKISYQSIREYIEEIPPRGSKEVAYKPSNQQINRLLRKLESAGIIERQHKNHLKEHMVFRLVLATSDLNRLNEERQGSDTRGATLGATHKKPVNTRPLSDMTDTMTDKGATPEERHTSVTSVKDTLSITREDDFPAETNSATGEELEFDNQFLLMARTCGMETRDFSDEDVKTVFDIFKTYRHNATTLRTTATWLNLWRTWATREKARYAKRQAPKQPLPGNQPYRNAFDAAADVFEQSRQFAEREEGISDFDEQSGSGYQSIPSRLRR